MRITILFSIRKHAETFRAQPARDFRRAVLRSEPLPSATVCRWGKANGDDALKKEMAGLLGAVAALGTIATAQATPAPAPTDVLAANSYAELLQPIPDASARLKALDEQQHAGGETKGIQLAFRHHHHHHHHYRRHYHHHHHHRY
jgi:hypothetical protein